MKTEAIITLSLAPPESKKQISNIGFATVQSTGVLTDSNTAYTKRITGEPDLVRLDGSYQFYESPSDCCYSTVMSGADGQFYDGAAPVSLSISFAQVQKSRGITLYFGDTCAANFSVYWYSGSTQQAAKSVTENISNPCIVTLDQDVEYDRVQIVFTKTDQPYRYLKLTEIDFGEAVIYNASNLIAANMHEEVDISGASTPASTLKISVHDPGQQLNPANPNGLYYRLTRGMQMRVDMVMDNASAPGGGYYLDTWEGSQTTVSKLTAVNCFGYFKGEEPEHESRFYNAETPANILSDFAGSIYANLAVDALPVSSLTGYIPRKAVREALCHLCVAVGGYAVAERDGTVKIKALSLDPYDPVELSEDDMFEEPAITSIKRKDGYRIEFYAYEISAESSGSGMANKAYYAPIQNRVVCNSVGMGGPASDINVEATGVTGHKVYYDRVEYTWELAKGCSIFVSGYPVTVTKYTTDTPETPDAVSIKEIPLITAANYDTVLNAMTEYCSRNVKLKFKMRPPLNLSCGCGVVVPTRHGSITGNISSMDIDLTGGMLANVEVIAHVDTTEN